MIQCDDLWYAYRDQIPIIQGFTAKWSSDVINVVQGVMGSGKTTLSQLISGALKPRSGTIRFGVDDPKLWTSANQSLALVPQVGCSVPHEVYEVIQQVLWSDGIYRNKDERIASVLYQVGLSGYERRTVNTLSGFELARFHLALALVKSPQYLIFDESPFLGDPSWRASFEGLLSQLLSRGCTIVWLAAQKPSWSLPSQVFRLHHGGCHAGISRAL